METKCSWYQSKHYPSHACGCKSNQAYFKVKAHIHCAHQQWLTLFSVVTIKYGEQHIYVASHLAWSHRRCLLTGRGSLWKQTSPEHNVSAEHLAFSNCWCAAVDCCHQKLLVSKSWYVQGLHHLMRLRNHNVFTMKNIFASKQLRSAQHLSCSERKEIEFKKGKQHPHMLSVSQVERQWGAQTVNTGSHNNTCSCRPFCSKQCANGESYNLSPKQGFTPVSEITSEISTNCLIVYLPAYRVLLWTLKCWVAIYVLCEKCTCKGWATSTVSEGIVYWHKWA